MFFSENSVRLPVSFFIIDLFIFKHRDMQDSSSEKVYTEKVKRLSSSASEMMAIPVRRI